MKNIKYIFFSLIILFISISRVQASCTDEELSILKQTADKIKITYKHLGKVEDEEGTFYNRFEVNVKNIPDDFYILTLYDTIRLEPKNEIITKIFNSGTWYFDVYSKKCDKKLSQIKVYIPKFNTYSLNPLCEGIDGEDFSLCNKYYEYADRITYNEFEARVKHYRMTHKIEDIKENNNSNSILLLLNKIIDFIIEYRFYLSISLLVILLILILLIITNKKGRRGVLE